MRTRRSRRVRASATVARCSSTRSASCSLDLQPKLLRALEQRKIQRIGSTVELAVDVRILAATNRDLEAEVAQGRFRQDLFFRLSAAVVAVPPLRARLADLPELVDSILAAEGRRLRVTRETLEALASYDWPGNVRELRNVLDGRRGDGRRRSARAPPLAARSSSGAATRRSRTSRSEAVARIDRARRDRADAQARRRQQGQSGEGARHRASTFINKLRRHGLL